MNDYDKVWYCGDEDDCDDYDEVNQVECITVHDTIVWYGHLMPHGRADQSKHDWKRKYGFKIQYQARFLDPISEVEF